MILDEGLGILKNCEQSVRELASRATSEGVYEIALQLVALAQDISRIADRFEMQLAREEDQAESDILAVREDNPAARMHTESKPERGSARQQTSSKSRSKSVKTKAYPKFFRQKNELVKIGWSKSRGDEYWHKASKKVVDLLVKGLVENATSKDLFTADDVLPLLTSGNTEIPSYQFYLCLAWLRKEDLVTQVGRQGYRLANPERLIESVENKWRRLPSRDY